MLYDATKQHEVLDDVESVLWVLLFIAHKYFPYEGKFLEGMFDETHQRMRGPPDQEPFGGLLKRLWLSGEVLGRFACPSLEKFFLEFRLFHKDLRRRSKAASNSESGEGKQSFNRFKADLQQDLYKLLAYFDDILDDPTADWSNGDSLSEGSDSTMVDRVEEDNRPHPQGQKRKRGPVEPHEDGRLPKRAARSGDSHPQDLRPSRQKRAPVLPRKVYNLRPRKKPQ